MVGVNRFIIVFLFLSFFSTRAFGATATQSQSLKLLRIRFRMETIDNLEKRNIISGAVAKTERLAYLAKASQTLGRAVTYSELKNLCQNLTVVPIGPKRLKEVPAALSANKSMVFFISLLVAATAIWFGLKTLPLAPVVGFGSRELFVRFLSVITTLTVLLGLLCLLRIKGTEVTGCAPLEEEALRYLSYLFYGGSIILASKWYRPQGRVRPNVFALTSIIMAIGLGKYLLLSQALKIGIFFLGLFLLTKYFEIPWKKHAYIIAVLGLAGMAYLLYLLRLSYPGYFLF
mgnify:CR=1 FL=1